MALKELTTTKYIVRRDGQIRLERRNPGNRPSCTMRRAVITGLGAVTPVGNDVPTTWANLVAGVSGVDPDQQLRRQPVSGQHRGEVKEFDPALAMSVKETRKTGRNVHFGMAAATEARATRGSRTSTRRVPE